MRVIVGLSGGVDSAVSATLLKKVGCEVVGAFIKTWQPPLMMGQAGGCGWREERRDAMRVAAHLNIPFITIDLEKEYKESVVDYMIGEYRSGRTPNPDVMCNKEIKFGAFMKRALDLGADAIATGHYARTNLQEVPNLETSLQLLCGIDDNKDQSYFLWTLTQEQLSKTIFPVGHLYKNEVRGLAKKFKLPVANKKDSQGICFLGHIDMKDFLSHYIKVECGNVLNLQGAKIGEHDGAVFYTLGQSWSHSVLASPRLRKASKTSRGEYQRLYVIAKDVESNTITVSTKLPTPSNINTQIIKLKNVNWVSGLVPNTKHLTAQIRYHGEKLSCRILSRGQSSGHKNYLTGGLTSVSFAEHVLVASGQSVVFYNGDVCLGGGIVD